MHKGIQDEQRDESRNLTQAEESFIELCLQGRGDPTHLRDLAYHRYLFLGGTPKVEKKAFAVEKKKK